MFYGTAEDFTTYHESRGRTVSGAWDDDIIESALLVASEWLDGVYGTLWIGEPTDGFSQERQWPRTEAIVNSVPTYTFPDDATPEQVIQATYEAAFRQLTTPGSLQVDFTPGKYKSVRVEGAISVDYNMGITQSSDVQLQIGVIQTLMQRLLKEGGAFSSFSGRVERV